MSKQQSWGNLSPKEKKEAIVVFLFLAFFGLGVFSIISGDDEDAKVSEKPYHYQHWVSHSPRA